MGSSLQLEDCPSEHGLPERNNHLAEGLKELLEILGEFLRYAAMGKMSLNIIAPLLPELPQSFRPRGELKQATGQIRDIPFAENQPSPASSYQVRYLP